MSNARNLAKVAVDANGDIGTASLDNIDLTTRVAKTGDTMTGDLIVEGNVQTGALASYGQRYATWTETIATPDGGSQVCRFIEDCNGRYVLVGRFSANAVSAIAGTWSSVRGLDTSLSQSTTTAFSADWGTSYPSEVRILSASDFMRWGDTRGIDFIYRVPNGRQWQYFFNGGSANGTTIVGTAVSRRGFNVGGCYDGKGRWNNPNCTQIGMSDADYANPSSAYTTPTANAFNWHTAADAKLTAHATTGQYSGQDASWTVGFGYDDSYGFFCDEGFTDVGQNSAPSTYSTAVWILLKFDFASY